jgi:hypothetical protein
MSFLGKPVPAFPERALNLDDAKAYQGSVNIRLEEINNCDPSEWRMAGGE